MINNDKILDNLVELIKSNNDKNIKLVSTILRQNNMTFEDFYHKRLNTHNAGDVFITAESFTECSFYLITKITFSLDIWADREAVIIYNNKFAKLGSIHRFADRILNTDFSNRVTKQNISEVIIDWDINNFPKEIYEMLPDE